MQQKSYLNKHTESGRQIMKFAFISYRERTRYEPQMQAYTPVQDIQCDSIYNESRNAM
jgi:hypothetical protein